MPKQIKSIEQLRRELATRESELTGLQSQRERLAKELAKVEAKIGALMGKAKAASGKRGRKPKAQKRGRKPGKKKAGRSRQEKPLADYVAEALKKEKGGLGTKAIAAAAQAAGYKTTSKNFYYSVANILNKDKRFTRVSPGVYKLA